MTIRKLVELDEGGFSKEIDFVKLNRVANKFKLWLLAIDPNNHFFELSKKDLSMVESALNGTMILPFKGNRLHSWELGEGLLSKSYREASALFYNIILGMDLVINRDKQGYTTGITIVEKNGKRYAWAEFE